MRVRALETASDPRNGDRICTMCTCAQTARQLSADFSLQKSAATSDLTGVVVFPRVSSIYVNQLQDQRSPGYDAGPAGQQVPAHQALQH